MEALKNKPAKVTAAGGKAGPIRVSVVEDNARVRESLASLINGAPGFRCVSTHASGEDALAQIPAFHPHVVLMDIHLPRMSGIECVRQLKTAQPTLLLMMLTAYEDDELIFQALAAGATGYLLKQTSPAEIVAAIGELHGGGAPMSSNIARKIIQSFHQAEARQTPALAKREREILHLLSQGFLYKEIADQLGIKYHTVASCISTIYEKLHVNSRTEAVARYLDKRS